MKLLIKFLLSIVLSVFGVFFMIVLLLFDYTEFSNIDSMTGLFQIVPVAGFLLWMFLEIVSRLNIFNQLFEFMSSMKMGIVLIGLLFFQWITSQFLNYSNDVVVYLIMFTSFIPSIYLYVLLSNKWKLFNRENN